jgi:hypothetical protein
MLDDEDMDHEEEEALASGSYISHHDETPAPASEAVES